MARRRLKKKPESAKSESSRRVFTAAIHAYFIANLERTVLRRKTTEDIMIPSSRQSGQGEIRKDKYGQEVVLA
jgi:hypothetical protein